MNFTLTIFGTVISGVLVYVLCEWLREIWLEPLKEYKNIKAKITFMLTKYANYYYNPFVATQKNYIMPKEYRKASNEMRGMGAELESFIEKLSWLKIGIPNKKDLYKAACDLIGISNGFGTGIDIDAFIYIKDSEEFEKEIKKILKIYK